MKAYISPDMQEKIDFYRSMRRPEAVPFFNFPAISPSQRLTYIPLGYENFEVLFDLFKADDNRFVNPEFKDKERIGIYVVGLKEFAKYSPKRGAHDWILYHQEAPIGVLHLYDFSKEKRDGKHQKCTIGFAIAKPYRRLGFGAEAIAQGINYIFSNFESVNCIMAYTYLDNEASIGILTKLGFLPNTSDYAHHSRYAFFEKFRQILSE